MQERRLVSPSEITERPLKWIWPDRIPLGATTVVDGNPGDGKSTIAYNIAARVTTGRPMPGCDIGAVRSGLMVCPDPSSDDPHQHILAKSKEGLAAAGSLSYRTIKRRDGTIGVEWLGPCQYTAADLMGVTDDHSAVAEAEYVLFSVLVGGPLPATECLKLAGDAGVSERTLKRAKKRMGVPSWKEGSGKDCKWLWELPNDPKLLKRFKDKDIANLVERLVHGNVARDQSAGKTGVDDHGRQHDDDGGNEIGVVG